MDPRSQTQAETALRQRIAEEIVEPELMKNLEQMDNMPQSDWGLQPESPDNPAPEATEEVETPKTTPDNPPAETTQTTDPFTAFDWEALKDSNGLIAGKYKTPADAVKGAGHVVNMAKAAFNENDQLKQEIARLKSISASPTPPPVVELRQPENKPTELDAVLARIVQEGGTIDETNMPELRAAIVAQSKTIATSTVEEFLAAREKQLSDNNQAWAEVDNHMRQNHPDSLKFTEEIGLFSKTDPLYGPAVSALIAKNELVKAAELAWRGFREAQAYQATTAKKADDEKKEIQLSAADQVRKEAVEKARQDAGVIQTMAGGVHETPPEQLDSEAELDAAAALMRNTGDGSKWRAMTIGKTLSGPWFN